MKKAKWTFFALGDLVITKSGGTPSRENPDYWKGPVPWFSGKDLKSLYLYDSIEHVSESAIGKGTRACAPNSILVLVRGMTLMKEVPVGILCCRAAFNQDVKALVPKDESTDVRFIAYFLRAENARVRNLVTTAGHGTGRLPLEALEDYPVPKPPLPEQRKVADILTTWDEALAKLDALIDAQERRKKALMQQLLSCSSAHSQTSHAQHRLGDLIERVTRRNSAGSTNVLTISAQSGLVNQQEYFSRSVAAENLSGYYLLRRGEFAYNRSSAKGYPFGAIKRLDNYDHGVVSTLYLCFRLRENAEVCSAYFCHYFESGYLNSGLRMIAKEGARAHGLLNVTAAEFFDLDIFLPTLIEQERVAAILDAADQQLTLLRAQRAAIDQQKRGLMQRLLTGKLRVKP